MIKLPLRLTGALCGAALSIAAMPAAADTLSTVKERGSLNCTGHNGSFLGMAEVDDQGNWKGLDIDLCRAVATAIFGSYEGHLNINPISFAQRWPLLQSGELDVVIKSSGWTASRDSELNLQFSNPYALASTKIMVRNDLGAASVQDLDGGSICVLAGTSTEKTVSDYTRRLGITMEFVASEKNEESQAAYLSGRCDAFAEWDVQLAALRLRADDPDDHMILPDLLAGEPVSMVVRENDDKWLDVLNFMLSAILYAEQMEITQANVDEMRADPPSPDIAMLLGVTPGHGQRVGLSDDFAYNVIKHLGNYADFWERNLGGQSPYNVARGVNKLWTDGGVLWPMKLD